MNYSTITISFQVYFWTGSPALPASEDGFQPMPSVTIRPADDAHLPTANTCISRLYVPLYSSRHVLRHKILLAIKTKNFGFVWSVNMTNACMHDHTPVLIESSINYVVIPLEMKNPFETYRACTWWLLI